MNPAGTPEQIKPHAHKYSEGAWRNYSYEELAQWVALLTKRATHRTQFEKVIKDLDDAENYLAMMNSKVAEMRQEILKFHYEQNPQDDVHADDSK